MAATDYAGLKARWMAALATDDTDADFLTELPRLISDAEIRIYRDLDTVASRKVNQAIALTPGSNTVTLPAAADRGLPGHVLPLSRSGFYALAPACSGNRVKPNSRLSPGSSASNSLLCRLAPG